MESLESTKKKLAETLEEAERLHNTGDLMGALRAYRKAQKWTRDKGTHSEVQGHIDELHEMVAFVQETEGNQDKKWWEPVKDWVTENILLMFGVSITLVSLILLAVLIPMVWQSANSGKPRPKAEPSAEVSQDKYERGDNYQVQAELKGGGSGGGGKPIKKTTSVVTLTIPEVLYEPYPSKYVITPQAPIFNAVPSEDIDPVQKLKRNTLVLLTDKTKDNQWLHIQASGEDRYWIAAKHLSDFKYKSPAEIDAEIKASMGGKYWEIQVQGANAPFQYFLHVNAPDAKTAYDSTVKAYRIYAQRQMLKGLNALSHQKTESIRLQEKPFQNTSSAQVMVSINVYATKVGNEESLLGVQEFILKKSANKRYAMQQLLGGF